MPTVKGPVEGNFNNFTGTWIIDGLKFIGEGRLNQSVEQWSSNATLEYEDINQLNGTYTIESDPISSVGTNNVNITGTKEANIKITGRLNTPIDQPNTVTGRITWSLTR
ncbi:hypothetical protein BDV36DRAFT_299810 [Aspergillus pseudocaelatus]|uniref:Lipocalin-like domain-containing protein n=1 Tax=Aspergillus pseudocaelatus TaxID=1825620 RepID=A0ABQ6W8X7_9EURO|nr:hypothetical protein BDV36DRAFT_299810 [Aspergillus pseudocaelatus]